MRRMLNYYGKELIDFIKFEKLVPYKIRDTDKFEEGVLYWSNKISDESPIYFKKIKSGGWRIVYLGGDSFRVPDNTTIRDYVDWKCLPISNKKKFFYFGASYYGAEIRVAYVLDILQDSDRN